MMWYVWTIIDVVLPLWASSCCLREWRGIFVLYSLRGPLPTRNEHYRVVCVSSKYCQAFSDSKLVLSPSTTIDFALAAKVLGAVTGYEGENVFPTVFASRPKWSPPAQLLFSMEKILQQDAARETEMKAIALDSGAGLRRGSLVSEILAAVRSSAGLVERHSWMPQVPIAAGWRRSEQWIQLSGVADVACFGRARLQPREPFSFSSGPAAALTASDIDHLRSCAPNNIDKESVGPLEFFSPLKKAAPFRTCIAVMDQKSNIAAPIHDSQALLYCAGILINQALDEDLDERQMAYSILTDGPALQLNTLDFDATSDPQAVKNAAWVYETELYTQTSGKLVVNPEPLEILMDIIAAAEGSGQPQP